MEYSFIRLGDYTEVGGGVSVQSTQSTSELSFRKTQTGQRNELTETSLNARRENLSAACGQEVLVQEHRLWLPWLGASLQEGTWRLFSLQERLLQGDLTSSQPGPSLRRVNKRTKPGSSVLCAVRTRNNGQKLKEGSFRQCIRKNIFTLNQSSSEACCPERLCSLYSWGFSRPDWTKS